MCESSNVENEKQSPPKPPRSVVRIACEILAGAATGFAVVVPLAYVIGALFGQEGCFGPIEAIGYFFFIGPSAYGLASAIGVYLVGNMGKQTGSFLAALGGGFAGGLTLYVTVPLAFAASWVLIVGAEKIVSYVLFAFALLVPPIIATIGFNSRRRHK